MARPSPHRPAEVAAVPSPPALRSPAGTVVPEDSTPEASWNPDRWLTFEAHEIAEEEKAKIEERLAAQAPSPKSESNESNSDSGVAQAVAFVLQSHTAKLDRQLQLLECCLERIGGSVEGSLSQRQDRLLKVVEAHFSSAPPPSSPPATAMQAATYWKPSPTGVGYELRTRRDILQKINAKDPANMISSDSDLASSKEIAMPPMPPTRLSRRVSVSSVADAVMGTNFSMDKPQVSDRLRNFMPNPVGRPNTVGRPILDMTRDMAAAKSCGSEHTEVDVTGSPSKETEVEDARRLTQNVVGPDGEATIFTFRRAAWQFLEDRQSSNCAAIYSTLSMLTILVCVVISMIDLNLNTTNVRVPVQLIMLLEVPFLIELSLRCLASPDRVVFWFDPYNLLDLFAILASAVPRLVATALTLDPEVEYACRAMSPFFILLRLLRRFEHFQLLMKAFSAAAQALPVLLYTLLLMALFHASLYYIFEPRDAMPTFADSMWFTIVTMATVGYGDISPVTPQGKALTSFLILWSSLYTAIPIGIVGSAFSKVWDDRDRLLLLQQMRRRITRAGYTAKDLVKMFQALDEDGNGSLCFDEFKELLPMLHITMSDTVAFRVFETFDDDGRGTIDFNEFLLGVFPAHRFIMRGSAWVTS